jgi:hypothetical protein
VDDEGGSDDDKLPGLDAELLPTYISIVQGKMEQDAEDDDDWEDADDDSGAVGIVPSFRAPTTVRKLVVRFTLLKSLVVYAVVVYCKF